MNRTTYRLAAFALMLSSSTMLLACGKEKKEATKAAEEVKSACKKDKDKGVKLGQEWYDKNAVFKEAVDGASGTWNVSDPKKFNYCGVAMAEVQSRIEN